MEEQGLNPLETSLAAQLGECAQQTSPSCPLLQGLPRIGTTLSKAMPSLNGPHAVTVMQGPSPQPVWIAVEYSVRKYFWQNSLPT